MPSLPPPVRPGDRIGVAALSGPVDPGRLRSGLAALERLGFEPVPAANLGSRHGLFAGEDAERLDAFHALAADPTVRAVLFARGGHGVTRLLPRLDWDLLAAHPRAYVGYSDLTPFLLTVVERLDLVAFHGPMVAADLARGLSGEEEASLLGALAGRWPERIRLAGWVREGSAEGRLMGGCLSLLTATLGTPWAPPLDGALLFWEDLGEPLYRLDRMLTHLHLSDTLTRIRGMVVGHCTPTDCPPADADGPDAPRLGDLLREVAGRFSGPVATGLPAGHEVPNLTLPLGVPARLDSAAGGLLLERPAARPGT
ncbi:MAG: LD-carboxypeptidase [Acidobacteriota bacterium]|jgi:muramoyltetrapeptide carboxypeptidase